MLNCIQTPTSHHSPRVVYASRNAGRPCISLQHPSPPSQIPHCFVGQLPLPLTATSPARQVSCLAGFGGFGGLGKKTPTQTCPCGSGDSYKDCCKPFHDGDKLPETAEKLMRSRYSAYAKEIPQYVVDTTHPKNPLHPDTIEADSDRDLKEDVIATCKKINWEKLKILEVEDGQEGDSEGYVTFQTFFKVKGQVGQRAQGFHTQSFIEKSHFLKENGKWLYVNGDQDWKQ